jgi:biopolymer transport protein ExbD
LVNAQASTLARALEIESNGNINLPVILVADALASHQSVVTAMDVIGQSGFTRLNIATRRPAEDSGSAVVN